MSSVVLEIPDESLLAMRTKPERCAAELRMAAAVKLYEMGRLSAGAAALLAGVPKCLFVSRLADYGVEVFQQTRDELRQEPHLA